MNVNRRSVLLSKSKFLAGLQCLRYLWVQANEPARLPPVDTRTQFVFDQGHQVGELAKRLYRDGIDVSDERFAVNLRRTRELLAGRHPLFEAGFMVGGLYARVDILRPAGADAWDIIEVKSTTEVKEVHLPDLAFQKHCCQLAGLTIKSCYLAHINKEFVKSGDIVPDEFLVVEDVTEEVRLLSVEVEERAREMSRVMRLSECPASLVGQHCRNPYDCPLVGECWSFLPEDSVFNLYRIGKKAYALLDRGLVSIKDLPPNLPLSREQEIQRSCVQSGTCHVEPKGLRSFLGGLSYPLHYLDFETFNTAAPLFDGVRPYQNVPFQFSLRVVRYQGEPAQHSAFLADGRGDPRPELVAKLREAIGDGGSILVYNQAFELGVLRELARTFPDHQAWLEGICGRIVDLLVPFRNFQYYHPAQRGSASLKHVLPTLTGLEYKGLAIANGQDASLAYLAATFGDMAQEERQLVRAHLLEYCGLDTEGMERIVEKLARLQ